MLLDPRWDKTPSMAGFALFVASKDPKEKYNWRHCYECAVGQYLQSIGQYMENSKWNGLLGDMNTIARGSYGPEVYSATGVEPADWTFGKLADRILAYQMTA